MHIYRSCNNCIYIGINKSCLRYPPFAPVSKEHGYDKPDESDGNIILYQERCGDYEPDWEEINRGLVVYDKRVSEERRALKSEIKRLGGNPRKLGEKKPGS